MFHAPAIDCVQFTCLFVIPLLPTPRLHLCGPFVAPLLACLPLLLAVCDLLRMVLFRDFPPVVPIGDLPLLLSAGDLSLRVRWCLSLGGGRVVGRVLNLVYCGSFVIAMKVSNRAYFLVS